MIALTLLTPCVLALLLVLEPTRRVASAALPAAAVPALVLAFTDVAPLRLDAVLLGTSLHVDAVNRPLLLLCGLAFCAAAWRASRALDRHVFQFQLLWLLTLGAMLLIMLAADAAGFYLGYVAMTLAIYGLIIHQRSPEALGAGRLYLVLALAGEALILGGLLLLAARFGNFALAELGALYGDDGAGLAGWCLFVGFAVKMGIVPLHIWLPLAHPVAPVPASAVLSGVIVKAGLIGWLRFLPPAAWPPDAPVALFFSLGLGTAFYGAAAGLGQTRLKTVLAYSTVSQMGLLLAGFAASLASADARAAAIPMVGLLVLHHGLNKTALFLAAGNRPGASKLRMAAVWAAALALAGAPLTSGALAKSALSDAIGMPFSGAPLLLSLSSLATALLMLHMLALARRDADSQPLAPAWMVLVALGLAAPWGWAAAYGLVAAPSFGKVLDASWPLLAAAGIAWLWRRYGPRLVVPEGDVLVIVTRLAGLADRLPRPSVPSLPRRVDRPWARIGRAMADSERWLRTMPAAGLMLLCIAILLWWLLAGTRVIAAEAGPGGAAATEAIHPDIARSRIEIL